MIKSYRSGSSRSEEISRQASNSCCLLLGDLRVSALRSGECRELDVTTSVLRLNESACDFQFGDVAMD